jgi:hypothetical protein
MVRRASALGIAFALVFGLHAGELRAQTQPAPLPPLGTPPPAPPSKALPPLPDAPQPPIAQPPPTGPVQDVTILPPLPPAPEPPPAQPPPLNPLPQPLPLQAVPPPVATEPTAAVPYGALKRHGFSFGLRVDFAFPFGALNSASGTQDLMSGAAPGLSDSFGVLFLFTADVGYRITPHWYVGGYFSAGPATAPFGSNNNCSDSSECSVNEVRFGFDAKYYFSPNAFFDPWLGAGFGWETANISTDASAGASYGPEFLHLRGGFDFRVAKHVFLGPETMYGAGVFTNNLGLNAASGATLSATLHYWLSFGVGGHYDL